MATNTITTTTTTIIDFITVDWGSIRMILIKGIIENGIKFALELFYVHFNVYASMKRV
jgi:hypothetical protein